MDQGVEVADKSTGVDTNKKMFIGVMVGLFLGGLITWGIVWGSMILKKPAVKEQPAISTAAPKELSLKEFALHQTMTRLWLEHIWWTREYLKSSINNGNDVGLVTARLLQNQEDIGSVIKAIYGEEIGNKFTALLNSHILGTIEVVNAIKSGNQNAMATANTAWYSNAEAIASFLASVNSNWSLADLTSMMRTHLDLTKQEVVDMVEKKDEVAVVDFQKVETDILAMAEFLSRGIIKQFSKYF